MGGLRVPLFLIGAVALLSGGLKARGLKASGIQKGREESESRRLYSQIKYGEALAGMVLSDGVAPSLGDSTSDESSAEGGTATDPVRTSDPPTRLPEDEPPST